MGNVISTFEQYFYVLAINYNYVYCSHFLQGVLYKLLHDVNQGFVL